MYGEGISKTGELLDIGVEQNIIDKSGSWYSYNNERIGQGRENVKQYFAENPDIFKELYSKVRDSLGLGSPGAKTAEPETESEPEKK